MIIDQNDRNDGTCKAKVAHIVTGYLCGDDMGTWDRTCSVVKLWISTNLILELMSSPEEVPLLITASLKRHSSILY